jgi:hypothetical protein
MPADHPTIFEPCERDDFRVVMIPEAIMRHPKLSPGGKLLFGVIFSFHRYGDPERLTNDLLAKRAGICNLQVKRLLRKLEALGLARRVMDGGQRTEIRLVWSPLGSKPPKRFNYRSYLESPAWHFKANAAKERAGQRCQVCNARNATLNAHHRTYERVGAELPADLIVLCRGCHKLFHESGKLAKSEDEGKEYDLVPM